MSEGLMAWLFYLVAVVVLLATGFRILNYLVSREVRNVLVLLVAALLLTPAQIEGPATAWSPAFMAATIEMITLGPQAALQRVWLILVVMLAAALIYAFGRRFMQQKHSESSRTGA